METLPLEFMLFPFPGITCNRKFRGINFNAITIADLEAVAEISCLLFFTNSRFLSLLTSIFTVLRTYLVCDPEVLPSGS